MKRIKLTDDDVTQFESIKYALKAKTDVDTVRKLMHYFLVSEWMQQLFTRFEKELIINLQKTLYNIVELPSQGYPSWLCL